MGNRTLYNRYWDRLPKRRFQVSKILAAKRGYKFLIKLEDYTKLIYNKCFYCEGKLSPTGIGLDRKNNNRHYILNNVVPCCGVCNYIKNKFLSFLDMKSIKNVLIKARRRRERLKIKSFNRPNKLEGI